jgi:hypothetical protein
MGPCTGSPSPAPGTLMMVRVSRALSAPITQMVFRNPNPAGYVSVQIIVQGGALTGGGTAPGSMYFFSVAPAFCQVAKLVTGIYQWDAFPIDATGRNLGDIGSFRATGC